MKKHHGKSFNPFLLIIFLNVTIVFSPHKLEKFLKRIKKHHGNFFCDFCKFSAIILKNLTRHMKKHNGKSFTRFLAINFLNVTFVFSARKLYKILKHI